MIVIAGDSWACGEWGFVDHINPRTHAHAVTHAGITQYLMDDGYEVLNLAFGGASLADTLSQLQISLKLLPKSSTSSAESIKVFVFQTEWHRHLHAVLHPDSTCSFVFNQYFMDYHISHWMHELSRLALEKNLDIGLIGGASDTVFFSDFERTYPGVYVACQSMINLCINDTDRVTDPIFALTWEAADRFKKQCGNTDHLQFLVSVLEKSENRRQLLNTNPHWFAPDFIHANKHAHKKLYEFLKGKKYV